jgi:hypothetical protein
VSTGDDATVTRSASITANAQAASGTGTANGPTAGQGYPGSRRMVHAPLGHPPERLARLNLMIEAAIEIGLEVATRRHVAQKLGRVDADGIEQSDYKRDVKAAGGWPEIMRRARLR